MATIEPNRCYICKKLFCCIDCCSNHIKNKHCKSECSCPLCRGEPLIIRDFHHQPFLSHVIFNHLPLHCRTCGRLFRNHDDLKSLNACKQCPLIHIEPPSFTTIETSTSDLGSSSVPKTPSNLKILKKSISWTDSYSNSFKNSPPTSTRHTSTPMQIGFLKQKFSTLMKSPNIILKTPKNFIKSPLLGDKQKKLIDKQNSNQNKEESIYFDFSVAKNSPDCTPLKLILSSKSSSNDTSQESFFYSITEKKQEVMQEAHKSPSTKNDNLSSEEYNFSDSSFSTKRRLKSGRDNKDSGKKVRFSDQFDNMSIISEYQDANSNIIDTTGGEEFFEACQSFSNISSMPIKSIPCSDSNVEHNMNWKNFEGKKSDICKEIKEVKELTKENNSSSSSSKVVMMVLMEKTGDVSYKDLSPLINSSLKKLESIVSQSSLNDAQAQQNKENNGLTIVSVDSYTRLSSVECYESSEPINMPQKSQQAVKHNSSSGGIFSAVVNVVKNAFKNLSGVAMTKNSLTNSINSPSTSLFQSPIQHSTPILVQNDSFSAQGPRACKRPREENVLVDKLDVENSNSLNIVQSPLQKRARRWYKNIRGRQPIARMKDHSYPKGISHETQRFQQGALTVRDTILPLPTRALQVDRSTQTDF